MTRVQAPNRLHFGLLSLPVEEFTCWPGLDGETGLPVRHFGGVGLMIDHPGLAVRVEPADEWTGEGVVGGRAMALAQRFVNTLPEHEQRPFAVRVEQAPTEHIGLGVGTQLGLAVVKAVAVETGHSDWNAVELARRVGRGERSAIGVHGFSSGGLIVEGGKQPGEAISPLVCRVTFPADWAILLCMPEDSANWFGIRERQAFARLSRLAPTPAETETLCRVVLMNMLPALASGNLEAFGDALHEFNARVGDIFAPAQGGRYGSPAIAECVKNLRSAGLRGVGQSSWGPTVFAVVPRAEAAMRLKEIDTIPAWMAHASPGAEISHAIP
ncbi:beta-ribofuranosylaminobenzene 5'-phosphate synthase family protein [Zavarzinella formosa]|uniref:beta-ribofuranosylaminobenzene 5'-phosphate synthase family protein n=1 Tax=Zavarzinella formosa TaxID=360055 RepID=UPI0003184A62|nr:beta-ribofuranosylaminobenzene 5'-phosphate synthase family protein [Zavarzinella formosa]